MGPRWGRGCVHGKTGAACLSCLQHACWTGLEWHHSRLFRLALVIFEAKVESRLAQGRWLYCIAAGAAETMDGLLNRWALSLTGSKDQPWRSANAARWEIGCGLTGMGRAIIGMARRRAKLWLLPAGDYYRAAFLRGMCMRGQSWAWLSLLLLLTISTEPQAPHLWSMLVWSNRSCCKGVC